MVGVPPRLLRGLFARSGRQQRRSRVSPTQRMTGSSTVERRRRRPGGARKANPSPVSAGAGERLAFLDPPFRTTLAGTRFDRARKAWVYVGVDLPADLEPFRSAPYSRLRWLEDEANEVPGPGPCGVVPKIPRPIQTAGAAMIAAAAAAGWRQC